MTYSTAVKNLATRQEPQIDDGNSYDPSMEKDPTLDGYYQDRYSGDSSQNSPTGISSASELRNRIKELKGQLQGSSLSESEIKAVQGQLAKLEIQINVAQGLSAKNRSAKLTSFETSLGEIESKIAGIGDNTDIPGGWGDNETDPPVTQENIQDLLKSLKIDERAPDEGSKLSKDECIKTLNEALSDFKNGRTSAASSAYSKILDAVGGPKDPKEIIADNYGATPTKIEKDTLTFKGKDGDNTFNLKAPGDGKTCIVENADQLSITPKNINDKVQVSEEGENYVIAVGNDTFKVNKEAKLRIHSDQVSGNTIDNNEGNILVGATSKTEMKFISADKREKLANKVTEALGKIGTDYGVDYGRNGGWNGCDVEPDAKKVMQAMADAVREKDPKKQKELWDKALDTLKSVKSQQEDPRFTNDTAQVIFNVTYEAMGVDGFKAALKLGLIPAEFSSELSGMLEILPDENTKSNETSAQKGGPAWNHATSSDFLKKNSKPEATVESF